MRHWPISHLTMSRMCPPRMQIPFQGPFKAARSREGGAGQVCVDLTLTIVEWMTMVFFLSWILQDTASPPAAKPASLPADPFQISDTRYFPAVGYCGKHPQQQTHYIHEKQGSVSLFAHLVGLNIFGSINDRLASTNKGPTATTPLTWHVANE